MKTNKLAGAFPVITKDLQKAFEQQYKGKAVSIPSICGYYGRACRQMDKGEGANRLPCLYCSLSKFICLLHEKEIKAMQYFDKHGNKIKAGMIILMSDGNPEMVYEIVDENGNHDLGISANNEVFMQRHPDAECEYYSLSMYSSKDIEICTTKNEKIGLAYWHYVGEYVELIYTDDKRLYVTRKDFDRAFGTIVSAEKSVVLRDFAIKDKA